MKTKLSSRGRHDILVQIGQIPVIVEGKLSERRDTTGKPTGHKLQRWRNGKNQTLHVAGELVDKVREGTQGYKRLTELTQEYVKTCEEEVLNPDAHSKKKPTMR
ncbi:MAG: hypothetical protein AAB403_06350 [Planctomycetota bacterium]